MEMPRPGDAHKKLAAFVGEWMGEETMHPSPWAPGGAKATGKVVNRWILDGFAVVQEYEQWQDGKVSFRGHGVIWFDPGKQEYVMHWWDSMGGTSGEFRGRFDGDVLMLGAPMPQGGHSRTSWDFGKPGAHRFSMDVSPDGQNWSPSMEGAYRRAAAKKAAAKKVAARPARKAAPKKKAAPKQKAAPKKKAAKKKR
jgi:hypothetical protein